MPILPRNCSQAKGSYLLLLVALAGCGKIVTGFKSLDPLFSLQWHLQNTAQLTGGVAGEDINVVSVWDSGNKGDSILVSIVDDGTEFTHPDLKDNAASGLSYNYLNSSTDPGGTSAAHGTCVAGVIGARDSNGIGLRGVAPRSSLASYNMLQNSTLANVLDAMERNASVVYVSNNSWGPTDGTGVFTSPGGSWEAAVTSAVTSGRGGKGTSFFWAAGNGALSASATTTDTSNYDGYANYWAVTTVAAVGDDGKVASYSEPGANVWISAPSEGTSGNAIYTTDLEGSLGFNSSLSTDLSDRAYTKIFNGTSAAAPVVSGVAALIYKVNPSLTWRDVRGILARSARKNDPSASGWQTNGATTPYNIHYDYGFGVVDASAATALAAAWTPLGALVDLAVINSTPGVTSIPEDMVGRSDTITVASSGITSLEYVAVNVTLTHASWGDLEITLQRTGGLTTASRLAVPHNCYDSASLPQNTAACTVAGGTFRFGTARHLGEPGDGTWQLTVKDLETGTTGTFNSWGLKLYGN